MSDTLVIDTSASIQYNDNIGQTIEDDNETLWWCRSVCKSMWCV
jgi:hypothetical protein